MAGSLSRRGVWRLQWTWGKPGKAPALAAALQYRQQLGCRPTLTQPDASRQPATETTTCECCGSLEELGGEGASVAPALLLDLRGVDHGRVALLRAAPLLRFEGKWSHVKVEGQWSNVCAHVGQGKAPGAMLLLPMRPHIGVHPLHCYVFASLRSQRRWP